MVNGDNCDIIEYKLSLSNNNTKIDLTELENNIIKMENCDNCDTIEDKLSLSNNNTKIDLTELENNIIKMENCDNCDTIEDKLSLSNNNTKIDLTELENIKTYLDDKYSINFQNNPKKIFIYGCSHCKCFIRDNIELVNFSIINKFKSSASMSGVVNDISKLNYKPIIDKNILIYKNDYHIFKFGQVDIEYVFLYKTIVKKVKIEKLYFYNDIIQKYMTFLKKYIDNGIKNIVVCGSNLTNPYNWEGYVKKILKMKILPKNISYESKNKDILIFNKILMEYCTKHNIIYFDTMNECSILKENTITVRNEYIGKDHHYKGAEMNNIYIKQINKDKSYGNVTYFTFLDKLMTNIN